MAERRKLTDDELRAALNRLPGWAVHDAKLHREYEFPDFARAFGFMATAAVLIEKMNHHPEWKNIYNRVIVRLTTHDTGGITARDVELAHVLEDVSRPLVTAK